MNPEKFINNIFLLGSGIQYNNLNDIYCDIVLYLQMKLLSLSPIYVSKDSAIIFVRFENFEKNLKEIASKSLGVSSSIFIEVNTPFLSLLIIDCEKINLIRRNNRLGVESWVL